jgi:hypothetical protein
MLPLSPPLHVVGQANIDFRHNPALQPCLPSPIHLQDPQLLGIEWAACGGVVPAPYLFASPDRDAVLAALLDAAQVGDAASKGDVLRCTALSCPLAVVPGAKA